MGSVTLHNFISGGCTHEGQNHDIQSPVEGLEILTIYTFTGAEVRRDVDGWVGGEMVSEGGRKGREGRKRDKDETKGSPGSLLMLLFFLFLLLLSLFTKPLISLIFPLSASFYFPYRPPNVYFKDLHTQIISCSVTPTLFPSYSLSPNRMISLSSSLISFHLPFLYVCFLHSPYPAANDPGCCFAMIFDL